MESTSSSAGNDHAISRFDNDLIIKIVMRLWEHSQPSDIEFDEVCAILTCVHSQCCALDLPKLLSSSADEFEQDMYGMIHHSNYAEEILDSGWLPCCIVLPLAAAHQHTQPTESSGSEKEACMEAGAARQREQDAGAADDRQAPLDQYRWALDCVNEGRRTRNGGVESKYRKGGTIGHALSCVGWVHEDLRQALMRASSQYADGQAAFGQGLGQPLRMPLVGGVSDVATMAAGADHETTTQAEPRLGLGHTPPEVVTLYQAEDFRREAKGFDSTPVEGVVDYAIAGTTIDRAMHHLNESLPGGQRRRTELAFRQLETGVAQMRVWLAAKRLDV